MPPTPDTTWNVGVRELEINPQERSDVDLWEGPSRKWDPGMGAELP